MTDQVVIAILIGIVSTVQLHLAKALERQGIAVFDQLRARLTKTASQAEEGFRKPAIYIAGLILNNMIWPWPIIAQRYAAPSVYTSMFGLGLVFLMFYAARVMGERIKRSQALGALAIVAGSLVLGAENVIRRDYDRFAMTVAPTLAVIGAFSILGITAAFLSARRKDPVTIAIAVGLFAGGLGSLDPFLKGVAQNLGGRPEWLPGSSMGMSIFVASFVIGSAAFAITQWGFVRRAPASVLVPAYNANYIVLPVVLQMVLLPSYQLYPSTVAGVLLILAGMLLMRTLRR
jgi:drug/metabolite transporter (DMT)-like permease